MSARRRGVTRPAADYAMASERPVVINARAARRARISGVERWAREMVSRLPALRPDAYVVAAPPPGFEHRAGQAWEQAVLPLVAAARRAPLLFSPANLAPVAWPRNVIVVHDALPLRHPELFSRAYRTWHGRLMPVLVRRAAAIITVSRFSRDEIASLCDRPAGDIHVVSGGVDDRFRPDADAERVRAAHGLRRPYVLSVAGEGERKNLAALGTAARALAAQDVELVLAGGSRAHLVAEAPVAGARSLGYVPDEDLPGLYTGASAFVMPSRYEGFGLPCIEAMASGTPVVAADRTALPETCAGAALLVDPEDHEAIAREVLRAALDEGVGERLRADGLRRASELSWDRAARAVDGLLDDLAVG